MLRLMLSFVALLGLASCGADPTWAPEAEVQAARYSPEGEPTYITLYTVINKGSGGGAHSAILVNASERVIFDPAGTWHHPKLPIRNDVHFGMTDKAVAFYVDYHARSTYDVWEQKILVSPEVAEHVLRLVKEYGAVAKSMCTNATSTILRATPGFESMPATWYPKKLGEAFGALPGVITTVITDDTDETNHGILLVQANGNPLE
jgi:hypothetical protein